MPTSRPADPAEVLPGVAEHPHARAVLGPALPPRGNPSHAYLFHGVGSGKRAIARAFATALLADGARDPGSVAQRIERGSHPDLTWVMPSGAAELLVADIQEPVITAATHTPFESTRRVFVIEAADTMNDDAANRMLKTLEEPPPFVHLVLLADRREDMLATILSRCQHVRFDPLPATRIAVRLGGVEPERAQACARLSLGDADRASYLAGEKGGSLRAGAERFVRSAIAGATEGRPWTKLLALSKAAAENAAGRAQERMAGELELLPKKERRRYEREALEAQRRGERRARTGALDLGLGLAELWLRDLLFICEGAPELIHAVDRRPELSEDARDRDGGSLRKGIELVADARLRLGLNVSEELALEALAYRLRSLLEH